jgi:hypothetical protein
VICWKRNILFLRSTLLQCIRLTLTQSIPNGHVGSHSLAFSTALMYT